VDSKPQLGKSHPKGKARTIMKKASDTLLDRRKKTPEKTQHKLKSKKNTAVLIRTTKNETGTCPNRQ
jgi:hypothetical protein